MGHKLHPAHPRSRKPRFAVARDAHKTFPRGYPGSLSITLGHASTGKDPGSAVRTRAPPAGNAGGENCGELTPTGLSPRLTLLANSAKIIPAQLIPAPCARGHARLISPHAKSTDYSCGLVSGESMPGRQQVQCAWGFLPAAGRASLRRCDSAVQRLLDDRDAGAEGGVNVSTAAALS